MRSPKVFLLALLAVSFLSPNLQSQKFPEPSREDLQMTSDPKAPGAPAEYLFREEITDNFNHFVSEYARIKILTEAGKDWANVEIPFGGAPPSIEGRTIHPDGTIVPLTGSPTDLLKVADGRHNLKVRVFSLPSVEVGSVLEYRWVIHMGDTKVGGVLNGGQAYLNSALTGEIPYWNLQEAIPIRKEHFYWNPLGDLERNVIGNQEITHYVDGEIANYLLFSARLPTGSKLTASPNRDYDLVLMDVPAFKLEPYSPPEFGLSYHVHFYYSPYLTGSDYWIGEGKRWSKEIERQAEPGDALRSAAGQITAGATSDEDKARKLYDAVQALDNLSVSRNWQEASAGNAQQTWSAKKGTGNELAILYLALARAAGLPASAMQVADRSEQIFDAGLLSLDQLTVNLVVLHLGGKDIYVDPGQKFMPFGQLAWSHQLCGGLTQSDAGTLITAITPPGASKEAITAHTADLVLDAQGGASGTVKLIMNGPAALQWRQLNLTAGQQDVTHRIEGSLANILPDGVGGEVAGIKGLDTSVGFVEVTVKVNGKLGNVEGSRIVVPAFFFSTGHHTQFVDNSARTLPVDMHYSEQVIDDVIYHAPAGFNVEGAPQPVQIPWPEHGALVTKTQPIAGGIDIKHILARAFVLLEPQEYANMRDFYGKVAANDQQQLVFSQAGAPGK